MYRDFGLDLRLARRSAGYIQSDVAHLLGVEQWLISELERGRRLPNLEQMTGLSLVFGRAFENLFAGLMSASRSTLLQRLDTMPAGVRDYVETRNRKASLQRLRTRLLADPDEHGGT